MILRKFCLKENNTGIPQENLSKLSIYPADDKKKLGEKDKNNFRRPSNINNFRLQNNRPRYVQILYQIRMKIVHFFYKIKLHERNLPKNLLS